MSWSNLKEIDRFIRVNNWITVSQIVCISWQIHYQVKQGCLRLVEPQTESVMALYRKSKKQKNVREGQAPHSNVWGDFSNVCGDFVGIWGDVSNLRGNISGLWGDVSGLKGNVTGLWGVATGIYGDATGLVGEIEDLLQDEDLAVGD